jgi:hypothetical protein
VAAVFEARHRNPPTNSTMLAAVARRTLARRGVAPLAPRLASCYHAATEGELGTESFRIFFSVREPPLPARRADRNGPPGSPARRLSGAARAARSDQLSLYDAGRRARARRRSARGTTSSSKSAR